MKERTRIKRALFPNKAPDGRFGASLAELPVRSSNPSLRVDEKVGTPSSSYEVRLVPHPKFRPIRWYTEEHYAQLGGMYYHIPDKKYYPVIDTKDQNPYRRFVFAKSQMRPKRFYHEGAQFEVKPYTRKVIDLVRPFRATKASSDIRDEDFDGIINVVETPEFRENLHLFLLYAYTYADVALPLEHLGSLSELVALPDDAIDLDVYVEPGRNASDFNDWYFAESRVMAYEQFLEGTYPSVQTEQYGEVKGKLPFNSFGETADSPLSQTKLTLSGIAIVNEEEDIFVPSLRDLRNEAVRYNLMDPIDFDETADYDISGIPGPNHLKETLGDAWLHFTKFRYDEDQVTRGVLSQGIPYTDLVGLIGFDKVANQPVRGTVQALQFLGELPETVKSFADVLASGIKLARCIKSKDFKAALELVANYKVGQQTGTRIINTLQRAASADLFFKFGLMPIVEDLKAIADVGAQIGDVVFQLNNTRRTRLPWHKMPWADKQHQFALDSPFNFEGDGLVIEGHSYYNCVGTLDMEYGAKIRVSNPITFFIESLGFNSILGTAWEMLPMSFVVDWFVDVGSVISTLTDINFNSFDIVDGYVTYTTNLRVDEEVHVLTCPEIPDLEGTSHTNQYVVTEVSRGYYDPRAVIEVNNSMTMNTYLRDILALKLYKPTESSVLSFSKIGTLSELIIQRVRS